MSTPTPRQQLAAELRRLRDAAGLSTYRLAELTKLSQSRVSRIETGKSIPRPGEITAWVRECGATADEAAQLSELATVAARPSATPWRSSEPGGVVEAQERVGEREREAGTIRAFHPTGIYAGLLQTADFARHMMELTGTPDVGAGTAARLNRQAVLYDPAKTFEFLLTEAALYWRPGPPMMQVAQLAHIRQLMTLPNVTVGIIPSNVQAPTFFNEGFTVYEDRAEGDTSMVEVETVEGEQTSTDPDVLASYRKRLEQLRTVALYDDEARALLDRVAEDLRRQQG